MKRQGDSGRLTMEDDKDTIVPGKKNVTVVVSRMVFPDKEKEYDEWVRRLMAAARESPGMAGVTLLVPESGKSGLHHVVIQFIDEKSMHIWETSYVRQKLSHEADAFSRRIRQEATGLETWFAIPECPELETPPQWKMAVVTALAVYVISVAVVKLQEWLFPHMNFYVANIPTVIILVVLLTWAVMPFLSQKVFRKWLYKH
jgi:antibiotic biosynthesis monooxygenase (ABM) superfamily enzyme